MSEEIPDLLILLIITGIIMSLVAFIEILKELKGRNVNE